MTKSNCLLHFSYRKLKELAEFGIVTVIIKKLIGVHHRVQKESGSSDIDHAPMYAGLGKRSDVLKHLRDAIDQRVGVCSQPIHILSRAPLEKLQAYKRRMGWIFPWASSHGNDFNFDFHVSFTEEQKRSGDVEHNYRKSGFGSRSSELADSASEAVSEEGKKIAASVGTDWATFTKQAPRMSAFGASVPSRP